MPNSSKKTTTKPRSPRSDGAETRQQILQTAGQLFALKGYGRVTSKEICAVANTNVAAVNYHFGDRDALYAAVLIEAHAQLVQLTDLEQIRQTDAPPEQKLRALISLFINRTVGTGQSWGFSVLAHELMSPSSQAATLLQVAVLPKIRIMVQLIAQVLDLPPDHAAVQRGLAFVVMPCVMLAIAPKTLLGQALPSLFDPKNGLTLDLTDYALAGLAALKQKHQPGTPSSTS
ncbi:MAG: TetR/AcrR family transcriptional regulator [Burkholderiales bacterium]|nr:TetR/AcrR family transcriptional regulator [Burkholderiales bacterium]